MRLPLKRAGALLSPEVDAPGAVAMSLPRPVRYFPRHGRCPSPRATMSIAWSKAVPAGSLSAASSRRARSRTAVSPAIRSSSPAIRELSSSALVVPRAAAISSISRANDSRERPAAGSGGAGVRTTAPLCCPHGRRSRRNGPVLRSRPPGFLPCPLPPPRTARGTSPRPSSPAWPRPARDGFGSLLPAFSRTTLLARPQPLPGADGLLRQGLRARSPLPSPCRSTRKKVLQPALVPLHRGNDCRPGAGRCRPAQADRGLVLGRRSRSPSRGASRSRRPERDGFLGSREPVLLAGRPHSGGGSRLEAGAPPERSPSGRCSK